MSYHRTFPPLTVCTSCTFPRGIGVYASIIQALGADGLDLDLSQWFGWHIPGGRSAKSGERDFALNSVWITSAALVQSRARLERLIFELSQWTRTPVGLAIRFPSAIARFSDAELMARTRELVETNPVISRATAILPAENPEGARVHLNRLHLFRRLSEEWSVGIGFDLNEDTDSGWEAEAAIQIVGPRLHSIRVHSRLTARSHRTVEIHRRALRAAADMGYRGSISLVPNSPWWPGWRQSTVLADLAVNSEVIAHLFAARQVPLHRLGRLKLL